MAADVIIRAEGLGKRFDLGRSRSSGERYSALRDVIANAPRKAVEAALALLRGSQGQGDAATEFWALRDVSFDIRRGEAVGVIGRNGAGKSTLLKVLSRITEPSAGQVTIAGRVASLLEVGTGFHPELTGRENIQLNGAILGMSRAEIRRRFDEIVAFAEVEQFLDTPVKRYSSGMYVRLAFAVAAHLEPEILVIDEVLAVGDAAFQKKCLGKISEVSGSGRTVLFVSHNMSTIASLCSRCILLGAGRVLVNGDTTAAIGAYLSDGALSGAFSRPAMFSERPMLAAASLGCLDGGQGRSGQRVSLSISAGRRIDIAVDLRLKDAQLRPVGYGSVGALSGDRPVALEPGVNHIEIDMETSHLANGEYVLSVDLSSPFVEYFDRAEDCLTFQVENPPAVTGGRGLQQSWGHGSVNLPLRLQRTAADAIGASG
jgi:lipopolysaccharide transport system ATP-binding protein